MSGLFSHASCRAALVAALLFVPAAVRAQSADDVASRVGTVARSMGAVSTVPWSLDAGFSTDVNRGNTDTTNVRGTLIYVRDTGAWRVGSYLSGAFETKDGEKANERSGLNLAVARRFSDQWRVVLLEEIVRAPLDGLRARNLFGAMTVWTVESADRVETSVYAGAGWAHERFTTADPSQDYGAGLAGASAAIKLSETATLNLVGSVTQDLGDRGNYKIGSSIGLKAAVNSVMGLQLSYALGYDHDPAAGKVTTNNAISAGLTLGWKGTR